MKLIRVCFAIFLLSTYLSAEKIDINFKDLKIMDLVKITSKVIDKNILITQQIKGNVEFINNKKLDKDELVKVLIHVLASKGFTLVQSGEILRIVKLNEGAKNNAPIVNNKKNVYYQMVTEVFPVYNTGVDYAVSKVRHLISRSAKIVAVKDTNMILLTDFKDNVKTIKKVVALLGARGSKDTLVVELKNIKAADAKKNLDAISKSKFLAKDDTQKVSVVANKDNNSLVLIGIKKNINYLKKYIENVDKNDSLTKRVVNVIPLKNVEAKNVIKIIDGIIGKKKYIDPNAKPLASVDEETNSIVLMGPSNEITYVKVLLNELDKEKAQVYVQARIIELNDTLVDEVGVKYGIFGGKAGSKGLGTFSSNLNGGSSVTAIPTGFELDIPKISSGLALGASISLLEQDGALDIVSEPSILAINNKESSIYVGETISVKTSSSVSDGGTTNENFKREDVGLTLKVKPRISNDNKVTLEINTILEDVKTTATSSGNADTTKKEVKTTAIVKNGESVILGGLIEDKEETTESKIPVLGDIPLVGKLFSHDKTDIRKRSLVIIVTPYIIPKSKDLTFVRNQLSELKMLEDRFLKKSLIRLKQKKLEKIEEEKKFKKQMKQIDEKLAKAEDKAQEENMSEDEKNHARRVAELLGN